MNESYALALALGIGFVAGLRSMTAPAVVIWAAYLERINLRGSAFAFLGSAVAVGICSLLALAEFVTDLLPKTPNRTAPAPLVARMLTGALTGACLCVAKGQPAVAGGVLGGMGGVIGAFAGFHARMGLVKGLKAPGAMIAIGEDLVAIGMAYLVVFRA